MTIEDLKNRNLIILECISGSRAYGLETPSSDTDIKGVFVLPKSDFYSLNYIPQISNETNDIVYYELGRYMELLSVNNPNILELLATPKHAVLYKHPILDLLKSETVLSKLCEKSFGKFALSQIKKAKGLKKKIVNPVSKVRKSVLEFCYVNNDNGSLQLSKYLELNGWKQENCGLAKISHMTDLYGLYYSSEHGYKGVMKNKNSHTVSLSSIPKGEIQKRILYFNVNGYSRYCKDYKEYWDWVENRNEARYENTQSHGKKYDSKNMMHTFRLLEMAIEIAEQGVVNVKRDDREFLLNVKSGSFEFDYLLALAEKKKIKMEEVFMSSDLPDQPDVESIQKIAYQIRESLYEDVNPSNPFVELVN